MNKHLIYPDARPICAEVLRFKTIQHRKHICIIGSPHIGVKHKCKCGVEWTKDPELAGKDKQWSSEQILFQGDRFGEKPGLLFDPTQNYERNDDEESQDN